MANAYRTLHRPTGRLSVTRYTTATGAALALLAAVPATAYQYEIVRAGTRCAWYLGCTEDGDPDTDGLCAFHFDVCERPQHCDRQAAFDRERLS